MKTLNLLTSLFLATSVFYLSCQKDNDDTEQPPAKPECTNNKLYIYEGGSVDDSISYTYTSGKITGISSASNGKVVLDYDADKIVRRNYFDIGNSTPRAYDVISYNSNGTINSILQYGSGDDIELRTYFSYNNNKLSGIKVFDADSVLREDYAYTYTINNITRMDAHEYWSGVDEAYTHLFRYDTKNNFLSINQQALLTNGYFYNRLGPSVPFVLSDNNVQEITISGIKIPITYTFNANEYLSEVRFAGEKLLELGYQCK